MSTFLREQDAPFWFSRKRFTSSPWCSGSKRQVLQRSVQLTCGDGASGVPGSRTLNLVQIYCYILCVRAWWKDVSTRAVMYLNRIRSTKFLITNWCTWEIHSRTPVCFMHWDGSHTQESKVSLEGPMLNSSLILFACNSTDLNELLPPGWRISLSTSYTEHIV